MKRIAISPQRRLFVQGLAGAFVLPGCGGSDPRPKPAPPVADPVGALKTEQIKTILAKARGTAPGLAGAVISDANIVLAADGKLSSNGDAALRSDNWLHLGSNSKSMTAMAVAVLVEQGRLRWTDTPAQLFPEWASNMQMAYRDISLLDVLSFRAGFAPMLQWAEFEAVPITTSTLTEQRLQYAKWLLEQTPVNTPGTQTEYSNASYVLAGAIVERASGLAFEPSIQNLVLKPLGLQGFYGLPQELGTDQPAAHAQPSPGAYVPVAPDDPTVQAVPKYVNPAGLLAMPVPDYARYAQIQLQALRGRPRLLSAQTYKVLHTAQGQIAGSSFGLALGWGVLTQGGKTTYEFSGSIDLMSAYIKISPTDNRAVIVLNNYDAADPSDAVLTDTANQLMALKPLS